MTALTHAKVGKNDNLESVPGSYTRDTENTYRPTPITSSTDPFAAKDNVFAESENVEITVVDKGCWVQWSAAGTAATTSSYLQPANTTKIYKVRETQRYLRILEQAATSLVSVVEL